MQDVFRFEIFLLQYVTYLVQFVLSLFKEPKSKYSHIGDSEVSVLITHPPHVLTPSLSSNPHSVVHALRLMPPSSLGSRGGGRTVRSGMAGDTHSSMRTWLTSMGRTSLKWWPHSSRNTGTRRSRKMGRYLFAVAQCNLEKTP